MKKFICPYCFEKHTINTCNVKCSYSTRESKATCYKNIEKDVNGYIPKKNIASCLNCQHARKMFFCPTTGREIPAECFLGDVMPIALIGAKGSGKSNYLAVLFSEIRKKMGISYNCDFNIATTPETLDTYQYVYEEPLFHLNRTVEATDNCNFIPPLICSMRFLKRKKNAVLTFYDTSGSNLCSEERIAVMNRYIACSAGIIFMIDPLQITDIREKLDGKIKLPPKTADVSELLGNVVKIIRNVNNMKPNQKIDIPIAIAITKLDVLERFGIIGLDNCLARESAHVSRGAYVLSENDSTRRELEAILDHCIDDEMLTILQNFKRCEIFGLSALGSTPDEWNKLTGRVNPRRVLDPFLWILSEKGLIKKVK